jgi:lipid-A-disaccharide synthase-like uncharacterized protein
MAFIIFQAISILGLILIIISTIIPKKNKKQITTYYIFLILGGICLGIYSFYIEDLIFIILQILFVLAAIWGVFKNLK